MPRLIDADELLKGKEDHQMISTHLIWNAPTIDAVPVVRCKDCIHKPEERKRCFMLKMFVVDDFFCAAGERKEE